MRRLTNAMFIKKVLIGKKLFSLVSTINKMPGFPSTILSKLPKLFLVELLRKDDMKMSMSHVFQRTLHRK